MVYGSDPLADSAALTRTSRVLIETVRQTRLSLNALFKQTEIAIARSERLIKQTDENVAKWRVWGSDEPEQTIGR
jgi:hypothetical protein